MRILFLGDVMGRAGRAAVAERLAGLKASLRADFCVVNGENASGGMGLSAKSAQELLRCGVDVLTTGNHVWKFPDIRPLLQIEPRLLRPANYPASAPGVGLGVYDLGEGLPRLAVINLQGRTFMEALDCPFAAAENVVVQAPEGAVIVVDMHAEATSEKRALAHMLRGRVQAVVGTHTHVQTNDATILDGVTGYLSDLGMCGPEDSCLGMDSDIILRRFRSGLPQRFELAKGPCMLSGALMEMDQGRCRAITAWQYRDFKEQEQS